VNPKWNIKIGRYTHRRNLSLIDAYYLADKLQNEVLGITLSRTTAINEMRMEEAI
jgi:hypothetical protein